MKIFFWKYKITSYICNPKMMRRVGQGVKTPPFHGGVTGSIPVRGTRENISKNKQPHLHKCGFFVPGNIAVYYPLFF